MNLYDPITNIPGIGDYYAKLLKKINVETIEDLLFNIPFRYEDHSNIKKISKIMAGESVTVVGEIEKLDNIFTRNGKRLTKAKLVDETGSIDIIWFNQHYIKKSIPPKSLVSVFGTLDPNSAKPQFISPTYEVIRGQEVVHTQGLVPVHASTEGITPKWLRAKVKLALKIAEIYELLPKEVKEKYKLVSRKQAFEKIHFPDKYSQVKQSGETLAFEEMLFIHLTGIRLREKWDKHINGHVIKISAKELDKFIDSLSFKLTKAQERVLEEILEDLKENVPMNRLVQGDVGSGKTIVALASILACIKSGYNAILIAPTQILANQHFETLQKFSKGFDVNFELVTGKTIPKNTPSKNTVIVGTHAILHRLENFSNIGLVVIDEQQKFGVAQRTIVTDFYTEKVAPNLLTMTATPIPRSLALTFYGDLDLSVIDEMPVGRKSVKTWVVGENKRLSAYNWIKEQIIKDKIQAIVVCPFIDESQHEELRNVKAATEEFKKLENYFKGLNLALLHGRLKSEEKDSIIEQFAKGATDILVTTPVIEVGVDIPNANVILIETPEKFGLASLHQLRGRVGRGKLQGYCVLIPSSEDPSVVRRLKNLEKIHQGNKLAEIDLKIRGPGNIYGKDQHGFMHLKVANITDIDLIKKTKDTAYDIYENLKKYPQINEKLDRIELVNKD